MDLKAKNLTLLLAALLFPILCSAQTQPVHATIDASKTGAPISKYVYGQFLEHIGGIVNNGIESSIIRSHRTRQATNPHQRREGAWRCAIGHRSAVTNS